MKLRLQKFLSQAGIASRRKAEEMIKAGMIKVNGDVVTKMGIVIEVEKDVVQCKNKHLRLADGFLYFILNKPVGYVCTKKSQAGQKTIYDLLDKDLRKKLWYVGRLDKDSEGLVIMTNDGELTQKMTHPSFNHEKEYEVELDQTLSPKNRRALERGVILAGKKTRPLKILNLKGKKFNIILKEGRNRQLRRMFGQRGCRAEKLKRVRAGRMVLGNLKSGQVKQVNLADLS